MHARVSLRKAAVLKTEISEVYLVQPELFLLVFEVSSYARVFKNLALSHPKFLLQK